MSKNKYDIKQENKNGTNKITVNEYNYSLDDAKLDNIQRDTQEINKISKSKVPMIIAIIGLVFTISGVSVIWLIGIFQKPEPYSVTLFSEYSIITIYQETNMIATLNFEAESVSITAHLASGKSDTLSMSKKNSTEWEEKVIFNETGVHKVVATAITPDGDVVENSIQIEVIPVSLGNISFDHLF